MFSRPAASGGEQFIEAVRHKAPPDAARCLADAEYLLEPLLQGFGGKRLAKYGGNAGPVGGRGQLPAITRYHDGRGQNTLRPELSDQVKAGHSGKILIQHDTAGRAGIAGGDHFLA